MRTSILYFSFAFLSTCSGVDRVLPENPPGNATQGRIDLIDFQDFDISITVKKNVGIQRFEVTYIVTDWMNESFDSQIREGGYNGAYENFDSVLLLERNDRSLQVSGFEVDGSEVYVASFKGGALFFRDDGQTSVSKVDVLAMQLITLSDTKDLLKALQESDANGLGSFVESVTATLRPPDISTADDSNQSDSGSLEIVIIATVAVAAAAFLLLVFVIFWAWRYNRRNLDAYLVGKNGNQHDKTGSDSTLEDAASPGRATPPAVDKAGYPSEIGGGSDVDDHYPESVISEDVSTSLSQYYRSGMGGAVAAGVYNSDRGNHFNDNASFYSMESYGYSLDGYAPTVATAMPSDEPSYARAHTIGGLPIEPATNTEDNDLTQEDVEAAVRDILSRPRRDKQSHTEYDNPSLPDPPEDSMDTKSPVDNSPRSRSDGGQVRSSTPKAITPIQRFRPEQEVQKEIAKPIEADEETLLSYMPSPSNAYTPGDEDDDDDDDEETLVSVLQDEETLVSMLR